MFHEKLFAVFSKRIKNITSDHFCFFLQTYALANKPSDNTTHDTLQNRNKIGGDLNTKKEKN